MIVIPPYLKAGDTVAVVCPAGYMPAENAQTCLHTIREWGFTVITGSTLGGRSENYFSGTDDERLADLQQMLDDPAVRAILCGRGGYGLSRIIDRIDFTKFLRLPKWIAGYSDITLLLSHIESRLGTAAVHAPMAAAFNDGGATGPYVRSLRRALEGEKLEYTCEPHPFNRPGQVTAAVTGGNLALLAHLTGSASAVDTSGKILFIEDVGEYLYNVDRMLRQLLRSGRLDRLAGMIVGSFSEGRDTTRPFGVTAEEIVWDVVKGFDFPVCFGFPVGHDGRNVALRTGMTHSLEIGASGVRLLSE